MNIMHLSLGAVWPVEGRYHGPALSTGADGSAVDLLKAARGKDLAVVALDTLHVPDGLGRRIRDALAAAGWKVEPTGGMADDVASFTVMMPTPPGKANGCCSTGLILALWPSGRLVAAAAYLDSSHELCKVFDGLSARPQDLATAMREAADKWAKVPAEGGK